MCQVIRKYSPVYDGTATHTHALSADEKTTIFGSRMAAYALGHKYEKRWTRGSCRRSPSPNLLAWRWRQEHTVEPLQAGLAELLA